MPSPIAHAVSGYALAKFLTPKISSRKDKGKRISLFYAVFVAIAADFDFIPQLITGLDFHRGLTHTLAFAAVFSFVISCIISYCQKYKWQQVFIFTFAIYCSHLVLDFFTQGGLGIPLLSPFSDSFFISKISLFPAVHHSRGLFDPSHITFVGFELVYSLLLIWGLWWWQCFRQSKKIKL